MKKIVFVVLFACGIMQGQVGEAQSVPETEVIGVADRNVGLPKLEVIPKDNLFFLHYYDLRYPSLREVETLAFYATPEEKEYLYNFFLDQFETKGIKTLTIGEEEISVQRKMKSLIITVLDNGSRFYLSKRQLNRLFGKA